MPELYIYTPQKKNAFSLILVPQIRRKPHICEGVTINYRAMEAALTLIPIIMD